VRLVFFLLALGPLLGPAVSPAAVPHSACESHQRTGSIHAIRPPELPASYAHTGFIEGTITDCAGLPLPGVTVQVIAPVMAGWRLATSGSDGSFVVEMVANYAAGVVANFEIEMTYYLPCKAPPSIADGPCDPKGIIYVDDGVEVRAQSTTKVTVVLSPAGKEP
jgi:hypothetical protein